MFLKEQNHIPIIDNLRAIAALSVCFFHFICGPIGFITNKDVLYFFNFGLYGVQLFFVISGFIIPWSIARYNYSINKYFKFIFKRFIRLEPPYIVSIILMLGYFFARQFYSDIPDAKHISTNQLLLHIGYLIPFSNFEWINQVYWTLAIEFQFYLFMGLFYFVIVADKIWIRVFGYIFVIGISFIGDEKFLLYWLPVFLSGNLLFLYLTNRIQKYEFGVFILLSFIQIALFLPAPTVFVTFFAVISILFFNKYSNVVLTWIGKISYSIYLTHTIFGYAVINILSHKVDSALSKVFVVLLGISITIVSSYVMYLIVEKPSQRLSSKIKL